MFPLQCWPFVSTDLVHDLVPKEVNQLLSSMILGQSAARMWTSLIDQLPKLADDPGPSQAYLFFQQGSRIVLPAQLTEQIYEEAPGFERIRMGRAQYFLPAQISCL